MPSDLDGSFESRKVSIKAPEVAKLPFAINIFKKKKKMTKK